MEDFENSSDLDFGVEDETPTRIGRRAIASIMQHSVKDRIESKKTMKTLKDVGNAPSTNWHRRYWFTLFQQFAASTLRIHERENTTPTGEDMVRFLSRLPFHLQSRHTNGQIAWSLIKGAQMQVDRALAFRYKDYKLTRFDTLRINATIQKLLDDEIITKDPVREVQWLTCQIVKRLVTAVLTEAVQNGTHSWDYTLSGAFSLVMQAALSSRSGDFKRSKQYTGDEYIKWEDIALFATVHDGKVEFSMSVKLRYLKNFKRDTKSALTVELGQLPNSENVVDPTKLCIAYALRIGAVEEKSWSELVSNVQRRQSRRIVWTSPKSPVFYALTKGKRLDFSKPALVAQQSRFLNEAADLVGMLSRPVTHDMRRGAAADLYTLKSESITRDTNTVRRHLGHSTPAMNKGVTDQYIGREKGDAWAKRLDQTSPQLLDVVGQDKENFFGVQMAPEPFKKRKITSRDVDDYCEEHLLDKTNEGNRAKARAALAKQQRDRWEAHQQSLMDEVPESPSSTLSPALSATTSAFGRPPTSQIQKSTQQSSPNAAVDEEFAAENIDPALRLFANELGISGADEQERNNDPADIECIAESCISLMASEQSSENPATWTADAAEFVNYLSTINLISSTARDLPAGIERGNSRDAPTRFLFYCRNAPQCKRSFPTALVRDMHGVNCSGEDDLDENASASTAPRKRRKRDATDEARDGFPKPCPDGHDCGVTKDFQTAKQLRQHRLHHHDPKWPGETSCGVPGCLLPPTHTFKSRVAYQKHLFNTHLLGAEQAREYIAKIITVKYTAPRGASGKYLETMCLFPDCDSKITFAEYLNYTQHLRKRHSLKPEQYQQYMPTLDTVRLPPDN